MKKLILLALLPIFSALLLPPGAVGAQQVTLFAGGEIEWSAIPHGPPPAYTHNPGDWIEVPYLNLPENRDAIQARTGRDELDGPNAHYLAGIFAEITWSSREEEWRHGFLRINDLVRSADIAFANLEMPLSDRARVRPSAFRGATEYADAMRWAGFDILSVANNRVFDAETEGLLDTVDALRRAGIHAVGAGRNLEEARAPVIFDRNGVRVAFLAYTYGVSGFGISGFALPDSPGVMPLDPFLIKEDIARVRDRADVVVLSFHWGIVGRQDTPQAERDFAQEMIDAGADLILGHHPHVPKGVEVYRNGVIIYSLANLVMGHGHAYFMDNYAARLTLDRSGVSRVELHPLAGVGLDLVQPFPLHGERAQALLRNVQELSARLDTPMSIEGDIGIIIPGGGQGGRAPGGASATAETVR